MKCKKCGRPAAVHMRHHRLALCKDCYPEWFRNQTERTIAKYQMFPPEAKVLVAVSGGKDSLSLWDVLLKLGYRAEGLYIDLGIDGRGEYSTRSREKAEAFAASRPGAVLSVLDLRAGYGKSIPELARLSARGRKLCSLCGLVKRHEMNRVAHKGGFDALATGHNLDDEVATLFQNTLRWEEGYLARQAPVLPSTYAEFARKVKPFCRFMERETAAYAILSGIDYIYQECPHSVGAKTIFYKGLLNRLETNSPGSKLQFYLSFLEKRRLPGDHEDALGLRPCSRCGQPTSAPRLCAFCRLWEKGD